MLKSVTRLKPMFQTILTVTFHNEIGTSVWGLEWGQKQYSKAPSHTFFWSHIIDYLKKLWFLEWHGISRCGIFPIAQNVKMQKRDKIEHFWWKKHAVYTKFLKYIPILWPLCFIVDLVQETKIEKIIINIHFLKLSFLRLKLK